MAQDFLTLTDLAKINDFNVRDLGVTDLLNDAPFFSTLAAAVATNGTTHKYVVQDGAPAVGFRDINDGIETDKSENKQVTVTLKLLDASFGVDIALADGFRGNMDNGGGREAYIAREARAHLKEAFFVAEQQFINGTNNKNDGFAGLADVLDALENAMVLSAAGTTANTGSSVYLVRTGDDQKDVQAIIGNDGKITQDETFSTKAEGSATGHYTELWTPIMGWLGVQVGSAHSVGRICNLTADANKGLTDDLIYDSLETFPASRQPNVIVMNRRSLGQLRKSRTATNQTGAPAPRPTEVDGIPIVVTDAISNTEGIIAPA
ncbi:major capsid protein [Thalassoglobus polymorphus]|uniref:Phage capsid family protein n=1 Tax=Thalassoglobus polymorphus TaxID=2527994 RepID=A0A517QH62_9PLAN|nr:hypothetical protein [Thalassoglobus polymorphus]QDT30931.1 Phage capsid family protein [Thalassoglobus polymorphus]QDT30976.1 Phage capsid family protein [Thalassoglobus polymorphus]